ncbi:MAG: ABC transporter permease [Alphaproteobacteria bacterium]|nr:MAG: ABC transporter permease [Alphaproteobacteria bacterium]
MNAVLRRLMGMVPTLVLVIGLVFLLIHMVPGDPVVALLGDRASPADYEALRRALGLDLPLYQQFMNFAGGLLHGDWGTSMVTQKPVLSMLYERLPATGQLTAGAIGIAVVLGAALGVLGSSGRQGAQVGVDYLTLAIMATPSFVIGPLLIAGIAVGLGVLPVSGRHGWESVILPSLTLGLGLAAVVARMLTASLNEETHKDYVRTVIAKGGGKGRAMWHAVRNALLPTVQIVFLQLGMVLTGAVLTEAVFGWPGLGNLLVEALHQRDYPVIQGCLLFISLVYMVCVLLADVVSAMLDPRVRS